MLIYLVSLGVVIVGYPIIHMTSIKYKKELYVTSVGLWLFLVLALRGDNIGTDLVRYIPWYSFWGELSWPEFFFEYNQKDCEIGYIIFNKLLYCIHKSPRILLVAVAAIAVGFTAVSIYRYSSMAWLSFFMYITMGLYIKPFSTLRQAVAMGVILLSYKYVKQNEFIKFLLVVLAAGLFHKTALCFILVFFLSKIRISKTYLGLMLAADVVFLVFGKEILTFLAKLVHYESYIKRIGSGNGGGMLLIHISILILVLMVIRGTKEEMGLEIHCLLLAIMFNVLALQMGVADRIMVYYDMVLLFTMPRTIRLIKERQMRNLVCVLFCFGLFTYYICIICRVDNSSIIPYQFWTA